MTLTPVRQGILARLGRDTRGNTLAMVGAALVPLTAMIGSGVDMSRAYMAKVRLQSACDAASLAGRRAMTNDTLSTAVTTEANKFFNFNFQQGMYQTATFTPTVTRPATGTVRVAAETTIPTTVMSLFGFTTLPLSVECEAKLNFVNTDVVLVLDVTGSMDEELDGTKKIVSLREAVMALYDELAPIQTQLEAGGLRLRYGIVPYSTTVNVGALIRGASPAYLADNVEYQSRVFNYNTPVYTGTPSTPDAPVEQVYGSSISQSDCDAYGRNVNFSGFSRSATTGGGPAPALTWTRSFSNNEAQGVDWGWSGAADTGGTNRSCRRRYVHTDTTYAVSAYSYTSTSYEAESIDTSQYKLGNSVTYADASNPGGTMVAAGSYDAAELAADGVGISTSTGSWSGCIMERDTVSTITSASGYTIPSNAYDLNINLIPYDDATRWRPMWRVLSYRRTAGSASASTGTSMASSPCPAAAKRLQAWTRGDMQSYVNGLTPTGNTYHDIGMIWGARLISSAGIFADSIDTFNGMPVTRHVIFMTDGELVSTNTGLAAYGIEQNDMRISGVSDSGDTARNALHEHRFKMVCNATKGLNVSMWVIAFGLNSTPALDECASNANQVSTIANKAALIAKFTEIGKNIGALRLTQ